MRAIEQKSSEYDPENFTPVTKTTNKFERQAFSS